MTHSSLVAPPRIASTSHQARLGVFALGAGVAALAVYFLTLPRDLSWANWSADGGELITASATLGIPHPPGYPTYVVAGKLFSLLPWGTVAFRYNLFSAVCAAAAVGMLVLVIGAIHERTRPAVAAAVVLLFGFAPLVWSQAIIAEVYSLNLLLLATFLFVWSRRGASILAGACLGLAITTHLTSILFIPALLIIARRRAWRPAVGIMIGLIPLLLVPFSALGDSPVVWGQPTDAAGWLWLVSARLYSSNFQPAFDLARLSALLTSLAFGPAAFVGAGAFARYTGARYPSAAVINTRPSSLSLAGTAALYVVFAAAYNTPDAAVLLLPAILILAVLAAPLLDRLANLTLILPFVLLLTTFSSRDLSGQQSPRAASEALLLAAPANALLLTPGDRTIFTLWYFHHVEGIRPDLRLVDANLFAFDWYRSRLGALYPELSVPEGDDLNALKSDNSRPFCVAGLIALPQPVAGLSTSTVIEQDAPPHLHCDEENH